MSRCAIWFIILSTVVILNILNTAGCRPYFSAPKEDIVIYMSGLNQDTWEIIVSLILESNVMRSPYKIVYKKSGEKVKGNDAYDMNLVEIIKEHSKERNEERVIIRGVPYPKFKGNDDIFTLVMASQQRGFSPVIDIYFIDLYWLDNFRKEWLEPFPSEIVCRLRPELLSTVLLEYKDNDSKESVPIEEQIYAIPFSVKGNFVFYRKDLLKGYKIPSTWDEIKKICREIRKKVPEDCNTPEYGLLYDWQNVQNDYYPFAWGHGVEMTVDGITSQESIDAMVNFCELLCDISPPPGELRKMQSQKEIHEYYEDGKSIFMLNWSNRFEKMRKAREDRLKRRVDLKEISDQFGIFPFPHPMSEESFSNFGSWGWIVANQEIGDDVERTDDADTRIAQRKRDEIFKFIDYISSEEAQVWIMNKFGDLPSVKVKDRENIFRNANDSVRETYQIIMSYNVVFKARPENKMVNRMIEAMIHETLLSKFSSRAEIATFVKKKLEEIKHDMTIISER